MKQPIREAIRKALGALFAELQQTPVPQEGHWVYQRNQTGGWQGSFVERPGTYSLITPHEKLIEQLSNEFSPLLRADYPEYMTKLVGLPGAGGGKFQPRMILGALAHESLKRFGGWNLSTEQMDNLLDETASFFDRPTVRVRLLAPVLNVHGSTEVPTVAFGGGVIMRPITDEEVTRFYGGNPIFQSSGRMFAFPDFVFVHELEVPEVFWTPFTPVQEPFWKQTQEALDRGILALSSFKEGGAVGYDGVHITLAELAFGFGLGGQHYWGGDHVPVGHYELTADEAPQLEAYAKLFEEIHPTLEMACQRLVDSGRRTKPRDSIVDSIIGLESILLVEVGERQRGETRFRFSLNYASLFPASERKSAFYRARDLYDLRSKIAHGGEPRGKEKIDGKEMALHEIAPLARTVLRETVLKFLPKSIRPDFLAENYWLSKVLSL
ncbi:HEPN domain-containing protein [Bradyrhizobium sp. AUGA SZCCT0283]|uniref:HEPN domain-containing protein n=1 Tax=Bradyrhizobium sp. AUGA SZCCT0283 TaxID=2807671 RepID=UPI001BA6394F|nr:HEPN domain-containing protein [Bradyrhizobium sp. AUGA SZCCT0283]MBR1279542.1 hypothetical protein [Bradyrhizobium sp. AUGA SZCCT0283]